MVCRLRSAKACLRGAKRRSGAKRDTTGESYCPGLACGTLERATACSFEVPSAGRTAVSFALVASADVT